MTEHMSGQPVGMAAYRDGCRCVDCTKAKRDASADYRKRLYLNRGPLTVSSGRVRGHLLWLHDNGVDFKEIAALVRMNVEYIRKLASGTSGRVRCETETAILAITRDHATDGGVVDAALTWRRLHGLMALGWPVRELGQQLGFSHNARAIPIGRVRVCVRNARAVIELCKRIGMTPGPSEAARRYAKKRGWLPYGTWDDDLTELADHTLAPG